jgi:hypothetical protein
VPFALTQLVRGPVLRQLVLALVLGQVLIGTFVAITMMGWWFPGRTLALVLPLLPLALVLLLQRYGRGAQVIAAGLTAYTFVLTYTLAEAVGRWEVLLAVEPFRLRAAGFQEVGRLFPNYTAWGLDTVLLTLAWLSLSIPLLVWLLERELGIFRSSGRRKFIAARDIGQKRRAERSPLSYD